MTHPARIILFAVGGVIALTLLWQTANRSYFQPRAALLGDLERFNDDLRTYERLLDQAPRQRREFREIEARTLGGDLESVDHRLRTRLNRIAEQIELSATVATASPSAKHSPARAVFGRGGGLARELRDMIDFVELDASISGEGTLAQVVSLVDRIEAETWIKRIHDVRVSPRAGGERFNITVRLTTLFIPDSPQLAALGLPSGDPESRWWRPGEVQYEPARTARFASLVELNPFRVPSPQETDRPAQVAAPPSFPWRQWFITGVAKGPHGPEIWLLNRSTGERLVLMPGQQLGEAIFVGVFDGDAATGDEAVFELGPTRFLVAVGRHLDDRTPIDQ